MSRERNINPPRLAALPAPTVRAPSVTATTADPQQDATGRGEQIEQDRHAEEQHGAPKPQARLHQPCQRGEDQRVGSAQQQIVLRHQSGGQQQAHQQSG